MTPLIILLGFGAQALQREGTRLLWSTGAGFLPPWGTQDKLTITQRPLKLNHQLQSIAQRTRVKHKLLTQACSQNHRDEWETDFMCELLGEGLGQPGKGQWQGSQNLWASQGLCPLAPGLSVVARFGRMLCCLSSSGHFPCHTEERPAAPTFPFLQLSNGLESKSTEYKKPKLNIPSYKQGQKCAGWLNTQGSEDAFFVYFFLLRKFQY